VGFVFGTIAAYIVYGRRLLCIVCPAIDNSTHFLLGLHSFERLGEWHRIDSCAFVDKRQLVALDPNKPSAVLNRYKLYCTPKRHTG
jgi:hypothetical protein